MKDNGACLSRDEQERIWERLYRSPGLRGRVGGSGLGLWIAWALVTARRGRVEVFSAGGGQGSTLRLHLPVRPMLPASIAWPRTDAAGVDPG